ncbi:MAG: protein kinase [Deltaproteobacteria bacterium]|nr:protein kinase [Deltaproteobacteria bacterium]
MNVGKYKVIRVLGQGGMAKILLATNPNGDPVVLKVPLKKDPEQLERLRDEARIGKKLQHPSVVETLEILDGGKRPILVVEYVRGASLSQLRRLGPLPPSVVVRVGRQIAEGLAVLHAAKNEKGGSLDILHRDVTGGNVLLDELGNAKLIDLGIARSEVSQAGKTRLGVVRGTLRYLAPELLMGGGHSQATDLWSLGVTLWEALLGRRALDGEQDQVMRDIRDMKVMTYKDGESVDPRIHDAIAAILATEENRLQKARAVANVFARLENAFGNGQEEAAKAVKTVLDALAPTEERPLSEKTKELLVAAWGPQVHESSAPDDGAAGNSAKGVPGPGDFDFDDEETVRRERLGELPTAALRSDQAPTREGQTPIPSDALPSTTTLQPVAEKTDSPLSSQGGDAATIQMAAYEYPVEVRKALAGPPGPPSSLELDDVDTASLKRVPSAEVPVASSKPSPAPVSALDQAAVASFDNDEQRTEADVPSAMQTATDASSAMKTQALHGDVLKRSIGDVASKNQAIEKGAARSDSDVVPKPTPPLEATSSASAEPASTSKEESAVEKEADNDDKIAEANLSAQAQPSPNLAAERSKAPGFVQMETEIVGDRGTEVDVLDDDVDWKPNRTGQFIAAGLVVLAFGLLGLYAVVDVFLL